MNKIVIEEGNKSEVFNRLLEDIVRVPGAHDPHSVEYQQLAAQTRKEAESLFSGDEPVNVELFGTIRLPFYKMGAIDSTYLWGLDELILFGFYYQNRNRYKKTLDIGANIGLHSIIMSRCGFSVTAYEPDPVHYDILMENLKLNGCEDRVQVEKAAISNKSGMQEFVRVIGNTTSSHLAGAKDRVYGPTETFSVRTVNIAEAVKGVDLMKIDAEGHEGVIMDFIPDDVFKCVDIVMEIGSKKNAESIFNRLKKLEVNMFAQNRAWKKVTELSEMPTSYRDGSLFVSSKEEMPWSGL